MDARTAPGPHRASRWAGLRLALAARETWAAWAMLLPAVTGLVLFYGWPAVRAVQISFTDWNLLRPARDVGWANYARLLDDDRFWHGLQLSLGYVLLNIPLQTVLGLALAVAMDRLTRSLFVKAVVLLPYLLSNVLVAMVLRDRGRNNEGCFCACAKNADAAATDLLFRLVSTMANRTANVMMDVIGTNFRTEL